MREPSQEVTVGIPLYNYAPSDLELLSFIQCCKILGNYRFSLITHRELNIGIYTARLKEYNIRYDCKYFDKAHFEGVEGYNRLMISHSFYKAFSEYRYLLIYQLDAYVFSDLLTLWCAKGYSYIGAPWMDEHHFKNVVNGKHSWIWKILVSINRKIHLKQNWYVGNGGLSLRHVKKSQAVLKIYSKFASKQDINEDLFWSIIAPLIYPFFKVPNREDAIGFAFEENPEVHFKMNNYNLPFGCHGWNKYDPIFWENYIEK